MILAPQVRVFDITDAADVARVSNLQVSGSGPFSLSFEPPPSGTTGRYLALRTDSFKVPLNIVEDSPSDLFDTQNGADYILITHRLVLAPPFLPTIWARRSPMSPL